MCVTVSFTCCVHFVSIYKSVTPTYVPDCKVINHLLSHSFHNNSLSCTVPASFSIIPCRLYLVTHTPVPSLPAEALSLVCVVELTPQRAGIEDLLLGQFLAVQNMKTCNDWHELHQVGIQEASHSSGRLIVWLCMYACRLLRAGCGHVSQTDAKHVHTYTQPRAHIHGVRHTCTHTHMDACATYNMHVL